MMWQRQWSCHVLLLGLLMTLSACGFHLRGMHDMPAWLNNVAIVIESGHRDLHTLLQEQLTAYHICVTSNLEEARYIMIINKDYDEQHITSVSSSTTPRQFQMTYRVRYQVQQANGQVLIPPCTIVVTRQLTQNSNRILGSNDEEEKLKKEMRRDAVIQIIDRIANQTSRLSS